MKARAGTSVGAAGSVWRAARRAVLTAALAVAGSSAFGDEPTRVAVVFDEQVRGVFGVSGSWMDPGRGEEVLLQKLRDAGYDVVDGQTVRANVLREQAIQVLAGDQRAAVAVGSRLQAPLVIAGKGYAKSSGGVVGSSMKSIQASVQLSAIDTGSGEVLGLATGSAAKPHIDEVIGGGEALAAATEDAAAKLLDLLAKRDVAAVAADDVLRVSITGLRSYRHYLVLKKWIEKNTAGFAGFAKENYTAGSADLEVRSSMNGPGLAEKIATQDFQGFVMNPIDVSDRAVSLKAIVREQ